MSYTFDTYMHKEFLDFENCCISDPAIELLKLEPLSGKLLDIACGHAPYLGVLQGYSELTLLDKSSLLLKQARKTAERMSLENIVYVNSQSEQMPFADNSFDTAMCSFALGDVNNWRETMVEMERVVKPGGYFILIDLVGGNNDFIYDITQIADVLAEVEIGRESSEIWCFMINYLNTKAKLVKYEEFKLTYEFPNLAVAKKMATGLEVRMKKSGKIRKAIHRYLGKKEGPFEIDSIYLKMKILKGS